MSKKTSSDQTAEAAEPLTDPALERAYRVQSRKYTPFVSRGMRLAAAWSWRGLVVLAAIAVLAWILSKLTDILIPILVAVLLAALLNPIANFLHRHKWPRAAAAAVTLLGFILVVAGLLTLVGQQLVTGIIDLTSTTMKGFDAIAAWVQSNPFGLDSTYIAQTIADQTQQINEFLNAQKGRIASGVVGAATSVGNFFAGMLIALFATFFFLLEGRKIARWLTRLLPVPAREPALGAATQGWTALGQYVRIQVIVAAVDAVGIGLGAIILGVPLAIPLTVLIFLASFIPIVGAFVTGVIAVLLALVAKGLVTALIMLGVVLLVQQVESHVLQPFLMGKAVSVHPLAVVLAVAAGSYQFGIVGALFAVPTVASISAAVSYLADRSSTQIREEAREAGVLMPDGVQRPPAYVDDRADADGSSQGSGRAKASAAADADEADGSERRTKRSRLITDPKADPKADVDDE